MICGPRATKEAIATKKNVSYQKMSEKVPEEEEKISISEISRKIEARDRDLETSGKRSNSRVRDIS